MKKKTEGIFDTDMQKKPPLTLLQATDPSCNSLLDEEEGHGSAEASKVSAIAQSVRTFESPQRKALRVRS
jgi:hypothetical protein